MHHQCPSALCLELSVPLPSPVIALGSELKNTLCVGQGRTLLVSDVHPDLGQPQDLRAFHESISDFVEMLGIPSEELIWAHDFHPAFTGTRLLQHRRQRAVAVQHHFAHAMSCVADADVETPVIAVVGDGMGYGSDGAIWGGEVLVCRRESFERAAHLRCFGLPGGDAAARNPWRVALSIWVESAGAANEGMEQWFECVPRDEFQIASRQLCANFNTPRCSSLGRLFDAAAYLSGVCNGNAQEAQAARAMESAAQGLAADPLSFVLDNDKSTLEIDWRPTIRDVLRLRKRGIGGEAIAAAFHATLVEMFSQAVSEISSRSGIRQVVLSGGCFFNEILRVGLSKKLRESGMRVATHRVVSTGDAGLSVGQAIAAAHAAYRQ